MSVDPKHGPGQAPTLPGEPSIETATGPRIGERSIGLFVAAVFGLSPVGLAVFSAEHLVLGIPVLALYLFGLWALIIGLLAGLARLGEAHEEEAAVPPSDRPPPDRALERRG